MDSIDSIAAYSTAMSQAQLQSSVAVKVLKMAQGQSKVTGDFVAQSLENVQQILESATQDAGAAVDSYA